MLTSYNHASSAEMRDDHVKDGSLVLGFFSRHGVEHEGISYLLPIGMESQNEQDLEEEAVSAHWIILLYNTIILYAFDHGVFRWVCFFGIG
jgi:hypothetical protein